MKVLYIKMCGASVPCGVTLSHDSLFRVLIVLYSASTSSCLSLPLSCEWNNDNQVSEVSTSWSVALSLQFESLSFKTATLSFTTQSLISTNQKFKNFVDVPVC